MRLLAAILVVAVAATGWAASADPYLCYKTRPSAGAAIAPVARALDDFLSPSGSYEVKSARTLCNPVSLLPDIPQHPGTHQVEYRLKPGVGTASVASQTHMVTDRFGTITLTIGKTTSLLVPSTAQVGGVTPPPYGGFGVRHYACHRAKTKSFAAPPPPTVGDPFLTSGLFPIRKPTKLCAPANKNGEDPSAPDDPSYLVCYRLKAPSIPITEISTNNQIRPERLEAVRARELCVPATIAGGPTTSTTVVTTTSTTTTWPIACGDSFAPVCWGECPPATPICASGPGGCACVAGSTPCGSASFPQCGGVCPTGQECAGPFSTPDGEGCTCVPEGSTCHLTCDPSPGNCPVGMNCVTLAPGFCGCQ